MHIITGLLLSALASRTMDRKGKAGRASAFPNRIHVAHSMQGRIRMYCDRFREDRVTSVLQEQLSQIQGIHSLEGNQRTGSLLIHYNPEQVKEELLIAAVQKLMGTNETSPQQGTIMQEVKTGYDAVNAALLDRTGGAVDVNTMLAGTLAALAVKQFVLTRSLGVPSPMTLFYWAFLISGLSRTE